MDEVEHDIVSYECQGLSYLQKPKAVAGNTDTTKFNNCFIIHLLNNLQKKALFSEFVKVLEVYTDEGLGN